MTDENQVAEDNSNWHKALVMIFRKLGIVEMLITESDMEAIQKLKPEEMPAMMAISAPDGFHLILGTASEAEAFSKQVQQSESGILLPH